ncbi:RNA polymerase sigma factor [Spirilliplanes yamanashiensis]|uniref:RNA polymerase sigma factor n=1 Tax=Spirilliplanes yamanashiensis TaxID=42233 RepID=A0A8J4DJD0_9ACTN|nr:sigma-70 family RNA polymerase sigma factor [Spirilliplanes yamanashiensis]MDP9817482.1 RNA polymerase sigma factor (sigma-70 family) [Spirilliplanes yamanashiensis]GIJ02865.1 RNA polymerase sigma factor [Spirilliplanes yamanashiensis]
MDHDDLRALVSAGIDGDEDAWNELVRRFAGLVGHVIRRYRLPPADTQDVAQLVWLRLVEHLGQLREPAALPGWLVTTTRHECERHLRTTGRSVAVDPLTMVRADIAGTEDIDAVLLATERRQVLLDGLAELAPQQRELLMMLAADPPYAYAEISRLLGIPVGSIGPTRSRILDKLRGTSAVRAYLEANAEVARTEGGRHAIAELE